jgi:hypothetical protein
MFQILAGKGADVTALNKLGRGASHLLLRRGPMVIKDDQQDQLCDVLITALVNGCDPNGLSIDRAMSLSDYALKFGVRWT